MPKAFISYNWTSTEHQDQIIAFAKRLMDEGVDFLMDVFDLKEGDDKYAYIERMVNDPEVSHVLMFCDQAYVAKANARRAGVGTESQIISQELYERTTQSKYIAIVCEKSDGDKAPVPTFYGGRIYIDFSSPEAVNKNWEQLLRLLHNLPLHSKPPLGRVPSYLTADSGPHNPAVSKWHSLRQALISGKSHLGAQRTDFLQACLTYVDELRPQASPSNEDPGQFTYTQYQKLKPVRDLIADWVLLESASTSTDFGDALIDFLEGIFAVSERPDEVNEWSEWWYDGHRLFRYELFLYVVAALIKSNSAQWLHEILTSHYVAPKSHRSGGGFVNFDRFYEHGGCVQSALSNNGQKYLCPASELVKRSADRRDLTFKALCEADALLLLMSLISPGVYWYPGLLLYYRDDDFPFFQRAAQHKGFKRLATVTGIEDASDLRKRVTEGWAKSSVGHSDGFWRISMSLGKVLRINDWNTIK
ncbi:MAG: toll/interleukin-1 receptor domain-containing protein [Tepidisphaeraceae bacterium]